MLVFFKLSIWSDCWVQKLSVDQASDHALISKPNTGFVFVADVVCFHCCLNEPFMVSASARLTAPDCI